jgi:hypothetical protein
MAIHLNPWGKYRGPGGPDSDKTRDQRKQELLKMMNSQRIELDPKVGSVNTQTRRVQ